MTRRLILMLLIAAPVIGGCASRRGSERTPATCDGERVVRVRNASGVLADVFTWRAERPRETSYLGSVSPGRTADFTIPNNVWVSTSDPALARDDPGSVPPNGSIQYEYFCR